MKVSVIMPVYNAEDTIGEAIDSVLAQTYKDREIIIIDDGSTDGTPGIVDWYQNKFYDVHVRHIANVGVAAARNHALGYASGELILPLDADDKLHPQYLEKTVPLMTDGVGVVAPGLQYFGGSNIYLPPQPTTTQYNGTPNTSLVRKSALLGVGGWNVGISRLSYEDWDLWLRLLKAGWKTTLLDEPLMLYRIGINARSKEQNKTYNECQEEIRRRHGR